MSSEHIEVLSSLARTRADLESRLAGVPEWRALLELRARAQATGEGISAAARELIDALERHPVYQGWAEIGAAMAKLAASQPAEPAAGAASGEPPPTVASTPPVSVAPPLAPPDDLLRIRRITQEQAVALHRLGVRRFADIAQWTAADVARISTALRLGDAISRQNWIEQAAARHLSQGGQLATVSAAASVSSGPRAPAATDAVAAQERLPLVPDAAPEIAAMDDLTRIRGVRPGLAAQLKSLGVTRFADIANWTAADVARISAILGVNDRISRESWIEQAAMRVPASELRVAAPVSRASREPAARRDAVMTETAAIAAAGSQEPAAAATLRESEPPRATKDDLTLIRGIRPSLVAALEAIGVTTFEEIANWTAADVARVSTALQLGERISREGWIEQAAARHLGQGGKLRPAPPNEVASERTDQQAELRPASTVGRTAEPSPPLVAAAAPVVAGTAAVADAAAELQRAAPAVTPDGAAAGSVAAAGIPPAFASALAAVKAGLSAPLAAQAARTAAPAVEDEPKPNAGEPELMQAASASLSARHGAPDRLELLQGMDAAARGKLASLAVTRFADIAGWTAADVRRIEQELARPGLVSRSGWIEQAAVLARGGLTAYALHVTAGRIAAVVPPPAAPLVPVPRPEASTAIAELPPSPPPASAHQIVRPPLAYAPPPPIELRMAPPPPRQQPMDTARPTPAPSEAAGLSAQYAHQNPGLPVGAPPHLPDIAGASPFADNRSSALSPPTLWPHMADAAKPLPQPPKAATPAAPMAQPPAVELNAVPGPAEPAPAAGPPRAAEKPASQIERRGMEGGLAAALAAAAAAASAQPRLSAGRLEAALRPPGGTADRYLEDLSDWVQDAADELPHGLDESGAAEADVAIVRRGGAASDLGAVTPGAEPAFDAAGYAAYRRQVGEASVDIVVAGPASGVVLQRQESDPRPASEGPQERGLKRLFRAIRGDPKAR